MFENFLEVTVRGKPRPALVFFSCGCSFGLHVWGRNGSFVSRPLTALIRNLEQFHPPFV
jgi:hypothetical protein